MKRMLLILVGIVLGACSQTPSPSVEIIPSAIANTDPVPEATICPNTDELYRFDGRPVGTPDTPGYNPGSASGMDGWLGEVKGGDCGKIITMNSINEAFYVLNVGPSVISVRHGEPSSTVELEPYGHMRIPPEPGAVFVISTSGEETDVWLLIEHDDDEKTILMRGCALHKGGVDQWCDWEAESTP